MHGFQNRGLDVPRGSNPPTGRFGRMFPTLQPRRPTGLGPAEALGLPGGKMDGGLTTDAQGNPTMDAGLTFFGQFIDHNISFDPTTVLGRQIDPEAVRDFRPPRLDMDNLYGSGPTVMPYIYDAPSHYTKLTLAPDGVDLARTADGTALIGDPRNDENMILAQLHLAFIKFHNHVVDALRAGTITDVFGNRIPAEPPPPAGQPAGTGLDGLLALQDYYHDVLAAAQQLVRWHFQWIVLHEVLPAFTGRKIIEDIEQHGLQFFTPAGAPFVPVEFAVAAFRIGHPTVRSDYVVNPSFSAPIFPVDPDAPADPRSDLRGGPVTAEFAVDWSNFFRTGRHGSPQRARRMLASLNIRLLTLPVSAVPGSTPGDLARPLSSLAVRNLLRGETQELPSGQDVARKIGEVPLSDTELGTQGPAHLWYYVLREAEVRQHGEHLGPVGARIVAEVLLGLLDADPLSYRSTYPAWTPTLGGKDGFGVADLLRFAGVLPDHADAPISAAAS
ncbi:MAG TPA: peroxidase family protein [Mycobacteriales bacterium]|nr:peroxidase family protein [Mycobacteriales bacterium]